MIIIDHPILSHTLFLRLGVGGEADAKFLEYLLVYFTEHDSGVYLAPLKLRKGFKGTTAVLVVQTQHGERYQHLVGVEAGIVTMEQNGLGVLDRLYVGLGNQFDTVVDASQMFGSIEQ